MKNDSWHEDIKTIIMERSKEQTLTPVKAKIRVCLCHSGSRGLQADPAAAKEVRQLLWQRHRRHLHSGVRREQGRQHWGAAGIRSQFALVGRRCGLSRSCSNGLCPPGVWRPLCPVLRSDQPLAASQEHRICHWRQRLHVGCQDEAGSTHQK